MTLHARPRSPFEFAVLLPYRLGYHPRRSVVVVAMHGRTAGVVQRHDVSDDRDHCEVAAARALEVLERDGADAILLFGFEDAPWQTSRLLEAISDAATAAGLSVGVRLVVRDGHGHLTDDDGRTSTQRLPRPADVPAVAPFVRAGVHPLPTREDHVEQVLPERDEERAACVAAASGGGRSLAVGADDHRLAHVWSSVLDPARDAVPVTEMPDDELRLVVDSLLDVHLRDALISVLCPGSLSLAAMPGPVVDLARRAAARCPWVGDDATPHPADVPDHEHEDVVAVRGRLAQVAALVPRALTPSLVTLTGLLSWWEGDGTLAGMCFERALEIDPDHRLSWLLLQLLSHGLRPWEVALSDGLPGSAA